MGLVDRAKNMLLKPKLEWPLVAAEPATIGSIYTGYAIPMALLPLVGALIGGLLFGHGLGLGIVLLPALIGYVVGLGLLFVMAIIVDALAPGFDGRKGQVSAMKLVTYAATPQWVAGFFGFIPGLNILLALAGFAYAAYLLYLGSGPAMGVPQGKAAGFTAVAIIIWIVLGMIVTGVLVAALFGMMFGGLALSGGY